MPHPYAAAAYVETLAAAEGATAIEVDPWGCRVLVRPLAGGLADAAGPYPRTPLKPGVDIAAGLDALRAHRVVSLVTVPDPFVAPDAARLVEAFDLCAPFKTHFAIDRRRPEPWPSKHHRYKIRRAERRCRVERVSLRAVLGDWTRLYDSLSARHEIRGPAAFSTDCFAALAGEGAFETFAARIDGRIVAMGIWFSHEGTAVYHLGASDPDGYAAGASYAIFAAAIEHYVEAERFDLGGAAGLADDPDDGLARFKQGFANARATAHLCGAVLDPVAYARLAAGRPPTAFFPAYRAPVARAVA